MGKTWLGRLLLLLVLVLVLVLVLETLEKPRTRTTTIDFLTSREPVKLETGGASRIRIELGSEIAAVFQ